MAQHLHGRREMATGAAEDQGPWCKAFWAEFQCPALPSGMLDLSAPATPGGMPRDGVPSYGILRDPNSTEVTARILIRHPDPAQREVGDRFCVKSAFAFGAEFPEGCWELAVEKARQFHAEFMAEVDPKASIPSLRAAASSRFVSTLDPIERTRSVGRIGDTEKQDTPLESQLWYTAFGSEYRCPPLPEGFSDLSWKNEEFPSYGLLKLDSGEATARLWMLHPDPSTRGDMGRFWVAREGSEFGTDFEEGQWEQAVAKTRTLHLEVLAELAERAARPEPAVTKEMTLAEAKAEIALLNEKLQDWQDCGDSIMEVAVGRRAQLSGADVNGVIKGHRMVIQMLLSTMLQVRNNVASEFNKDNAAFMASPLAHSAEWPELTRQLQTLSYTVGEVDAVFERVGLMLPSVEELSIGPEPMSEELARLVTTLKTPPTQRENRFGRMG